MNKRYPSPCVQLKIEIDKNVRLEQNVIMLSIDSRGLGIVSSVLAAIFTAIFAFFLVLDNKMVYFISCLFLSISVVVMTVSIKDFIPKNKSVFINCAIAFGIIYSVLVSMVYYTQISYVLTRPLSVDMLKIVSDAPGNIFFFIDMLGYVFLCLSTFFMALSVDRKYVALRVFLFIHSLILIPTFLVPFLPVTYQTNEASGDVNGALILVGWSVIFVPICLMFTRFFIKEKQT